MTKMTYKNALEIAIATVADEEVKDKLVALKDSLVRKSSGERKPTATQIANENIKASILSHMENGVEYTVSELMKIVPELEGASNQKASALTKQLADNGKITREKVKGRTYFTKAIVE